MVLGLVHLFWEEDYFIIITMLTILVKVVAKSANRSFVNSYLIKAQEGLHPSGRGERPGLQGVEADRCLKPFIDFDRSFGSCQAAATSSCYHLWEEHLRTYSGHSCSFSPCS